MLSIHPPPPPPPPRNYRPPPEVKWSGTISSNVHGDFACFSRRASSFVVSRFPIVSPPAMLDALETACGGASPIPLVTDWKMHPQVADAALTNVAAEILLTRVLISTPAFSLSRRHQCGPSVFLFRSMRPTTCRPYSAPFPTFFYVSLESFFSVATGTPPSRGRCPPAVDVTSIPTERD